MVITIDLFILESIGLKIEQFMYFQYLNKGNFKAGLFNFAQ